MTKKPVPDTKEKLTLYVTLMVSTTLCISVLAILRGIKAQLGVIIAHGKIKMSVIA